MIKTWQCADLMVPGIPGDLTRYCFENLRESRGHTTADLKDAILYSLSCVHHFGIIDGL